MLRGFHSIGDAFAEGFTSLRQVAAHLETLSFQGRYPHGLPYGISSLSRCCHEAEVYFGRHFNLGQEAELFIRTGPGQAITGLTDLGVTAWALAHDFLVRHGIIQEEV